MTRLAEVFAANAKLGLTSFGGPVAHIGYFHDEFVVRRCWLDEREFADLLALCQFLPGPASSQMIFAVGMRRAGVLGAIVASFCFTAPSAVLMIAFAYGFTAFGSHENGWLQGLKVAAVAVVAQAVWLMATRMCTDRRRATLALGAAALVVVWPVAGAQVAAIVAGGFAGWIFCRQKSDEPARAAIPLPSHGHAIAVGVLVLFAALLIALPILARTTGSPMLAVFDTFFRSGSLVFGGGHVVLPLLRAGVVPPGWISDEVFLAGYGAAQAVPGPLFSFAGYLGAMLGDGRGGIPGALLCLLGIFLPGWLLIAGALPFWETIRRLDWTQAVLRGTNAAVVGVLLAALYDPVWKEGVRGPRELALALAAFAALALWKAPPWAVVVACAAGGAALL